MNGMPLYCMQPSVTLIIPLFNASSFVERCTAMCEAQTMDEVEIVFVDDCSTDGTAARVRRFIDGYSGPKRFILTSTDRNCGPGAARNLGISAASGEYLCFVDCDDEIDPRYCELLHSEAKRFDADIASCNASCGGKVLRSPSFCGEISVSARKRILRGFVTYLWTYAFRREFIISSGISFPERRSSEDSCFVACAWLSASRAAHTDEVLYSYLPTPSSVSRRKDRRRGSERMASLKAFYKYASDSGLLKEYRMETGLIMLKKGYLPSISDRLKNI